MKKSFVAPFVFLTIAAISLAGAPAAVADDSEPAPTPANVVVTGPGILTLPNGDGVRDTTSFTVEADAPTTVALSLVDPADESVVSVLDPVILTEGSLTATVPLTLDGVVRPGGFALRATPEGGETRSTKVMIGSGQPQFANIALSRSVIYTYKKATARSSVATVYARDETGERVPFTGSVAAKVGSKTVTSKVSSAAGADAKVTIAATSLPLGAGTVTFTATAEGLTSKGSAKLTVRNVAVTATKVSASQRTVYPAKDGYLDATKIAVSASSSTGKTIGATGTVKIVRGSKTVRTWKLSSTKSWSTTWDGKVGGKVVPGTYTVKVAVKGPEGGTKSASTTIAVKKGKLVSTKTKKTYKASSILKTYTPLDEYGQGYCQYDEVTFGCIGFDGYYGDDAVSLIAEGSTTIPASVRSAKAFGAVKVKMTLNASGVSGQAVWGYGSVSDPTAKVTAMKKGNTSPGWYTVPKSGTKLGVVAATGEYSYFFAKTITVEYSHKKMVK